MYYVKRIEHEHPFRCSLSAGEEYGFLLTIQGTADLIGFCSIGADVLVICGPDQTIEMESLTDTAPFSCIWVCVSTEGIKACSSSETDLLAGFQMGQEPIKRIVSYNPYLTLAKSLGIQLGSIPGNHLCTGLDLMKHATLQMFLTLMLNIRCLEDPCQKKTSARCGKKFNLDELLVYIHTHLSEDLSLERIQKECFISQSHLIREFKKHTGHTVHRYIMKARLELSRRYIEQGYRIGEACEMSGFHEYTHFIKVFKEAYGMTPKKYAQSISLSTKTQAEEDLDP